MGKTDIFSRILLLLRLLLGGTRFLASGQETKQRKPLVKVAIGIASALLVVYLIGIVVFMVYSITSVLAKVNLAWVLPGMFLSLYAMMVFVFGIYYVISVFYYSDENTIILALPFRPVEIVGAKFLQTLIYEYMIGLAMFLPAFVTYGVVTGENVVYYLMLIPLLLLAPVIPLALIAVVIMLLMRVIPFARNKDRVATIMNIVLMFVIVGISLFFSRPMSEEELIALILGGEGGSGLSAMTRLTAIFPGFSFAVDAITSRNGLSLLFFILSSLAAAALVLFVGSRVYARTILNFSDGSGKKLAVSREELNTASMAKSGLYALFVKEMRMLLRTPAYLMNNILSAFIMPVFLLITPFIYGSEMSSDLDILKEEIGAALGNWLNPAADYRLPVIIGLAVVAAYTLSFGNMNMISATAVSREGTNAFVMKYIPQPYHVQFVAKCLPALILSLIPNLIVIAVLRILLPLPLSLMLVLVVLLLLGTVLTVMVGLIFDVASPKLKWENETQAVKNNMNAIFSMLAGLVLCVIPGGLAFLGWKLEWTPAIYIALTVVLLALASAGVAVFLLRFVPRQMSRLDL